MTTRTITTSSQDTQWGLFRHDAEVFDNTTVLQGKWYGSENDGNKALEMMAVNLPYFLKTTVIIKEVKIQPADVGKTHQWASLS